MKTETIPQERLRTTLEMNILLRAKVEERLGEIRQARGEYGYSLNAYLNELAALDAKDKIIK